MHQENFQSNSTAAIFLNTAANQEHVFLLSQKYHHIQVIRNARLIYLHAYISTFLHLYTVISCSTINELSDVFPFLQWVTASYECIYTIFLRSKYRNIVLHLKYHKGIHSVPFICNNFHRLFFFFKLLDTIYFQYRTVLYEINSRVFKGRFSILCMYIQNWIEITLHFFLNLIFLTPLP